MPAGRSGNRYSDRPIDWRTRATGLAGTLGGLLAIVAALLVTWHAVQPLLAPPHTLVAISLEPLAAPPEPVQEVPEGPQQQQKREHRLQREDIPDPPTLVLPRVTPPITPPQPPALPAPAAESVLETTAPRTLVAPPAAQLSNRADPSWEALLLGHLEKFRRYPATAKGQAGVAYVSFRMNRQGQLLAAQILRSSGNAALDRAALETFRRAEPLPPIPADRPDVLDLSLPVEFFQRR